MPKTKKEKNNKSPKIEFKRNDISTVQQSSPTSSLSSVAMDLNGLFSPKRSPRPVTPSTPPTLPIKTTVQANTSANFKQ